MNQKSAQMSDVSQQSLRPLWSNGVPFRRQPQWILRQSMSTKVARQIIIERYPQGLFSDDELDALSLVLQG